MSTSVPETSEVSRSGSSVTAPTAAAADALPVNSRTSHGNATMAMPLAVPLSAVAASRATNGTRCRCVAVIWLRLERVGRRLPGAYTEAVSKRIFALAPAGTEVGYSRVKHARHTEPSGMREAHCIPSSER